MRKLISCVAVFITLSACNTVQNKESNQTSIPIQGTWKLLTGTLIDRNDTTVTDYTKGQEFIKIINDTHFAFLNHDLSKGKDSATTTFVAGGGNYTLKDSLYTEYLVYCSDRQWEGNDFTFHVAINNDTLISQGIEKIDSIGVNRINIEKYVRVKD